MSDLFCAYMTCGPGRVPAATRLSTGLSGSSSMPRAALQRSASCMIVRTTPAASEISPISPLLASPSTYSHIQFHAQEGSPVRPTGRAGKHES